MQKLMGDAYYSLGHYDCIINELNTETVEYRGV